MNKRDSITAARVRELFDYEPETGIFRWRATGRGRGRVAGGEAGHARHDGYVIIFVDTVICFAHRLAWLHVHGEWPPELIDHKDGDRSNNRISNLRPATKATNAHNIRKANKTNRIGLLGVSQHARGGFTASIVVNMESRYLGYFKTKEDAHAAYISAKRELHAGNML